MGAIENMNKRVAKNQAAQAFGISVAFEEFRLPTEEELRGEA